MEENFKKTTEKLKQSNSYLEQFAYVISHDLQEPLRTIINYCNLLHNNYCDISDDKKQKFIQCIYESTMRMSWMIKDLLEFSKIDYCNKPPENIDIGELLKEITYDFAATIQQTNTTIEYKEMPIIRGIKIRIKQLFYNIISNALKFRSENFPEIHISYCDDKNKWIFAIQDNGIGIDSKYYKRIFGIFKRLYTEEEYSGTGIGLAICKKIVENHGGRIWINSKINKGSIFYFSIPK